jgi:hypothetical protein
MTTMRAVATSLVLAVISSYAHAQGYMPRDDTWRFALSPQLWATGIDGEIKARGVRANVDLGSSDIFDEVEFATQVHIEARKGDWAFIAEPTIVKAEDDSASSGGSRAKAKVEYLLTNFLLGYRFSKSWEALFGLRYTDMDNKITTGGSRRSQSESWFDLLGGVRYTAKFSEKWSFIGRFDLGGLGLGDSSDLTWGGEALFFWDFGRRTAMVFGYRMLDIDFENGSGSKRFAFDTRQDGPIVGVNLKWPRR